MTTTPTTIALHHQTIMAALRHRADRATTVASNFAVQHNPSPLTGHMATDTFRPRQTSASDQQALLPRTFRPPHPASTISRATSAEIAAAMIVAVMSAVAEEEGAVVAVEDAAEPRTRVTSCPSPPAPPRQIRWRA